MKPSVRFAMRLYAGLLRLYPAPFRAEFADEMRIVFAASLRDAAMRGPLSLATACWRELRDLPRSLLDEHWLSLQQQIRRRAPVGQSGGGRMEERHTTQSPASGESWGGLIPFAMVGLVMLTNYLPADLPAVSRAEAVVVACAYLALLVAFGVGWIAGFPRWFYLYPGLVLAATGLGTSVVALEHGYLLGLLFCVPLAVTVAIAWRLTHSLRDPFDRVWHDWTLLSFSFYGLMPLAQMLAFDDAHPNDETLYLALSTIALVAGAALYLRGRDLPRRITGPLGGMTTMLIMAALDKAHFAGGVGPWLDQFNTWHGELAWLANLWRLLAVLMLWPALLALLRRTVNFVRTA
jgi:hypothetical protein